MYVYTKNNNTKTKWSNKILEHNMQGRNIYKQILK